MIEINRNIYMNEETGKKSNNFSKVKHDIKEIIYNYPVNLQKE